MKILITGADGFIGAAAARCFRDLGWDVTGWGRKGAYPVDDIRYEQVEFPQTRLEDRLKEIAPEVCIHCAGSASVDASVADPENDFQANVFGTVNMLSALRLAAPECKFLFLSSAAVYGNPGSLPIREDAAINPISPYGYHKYICEQLLQEFFHIYGLPTLSLRIFSVYGPGLKRQVVYDTCVKAAFEATLHMRGTGKESRDFIYITDLLELLRLLIEKGNFCGTVYNVANGEEVKIADLAHTISQKLGNKPVVFDQEAGKGNPLNWRADISRIRELGYNPAVSLQKGIDLYLEWLKHNDPRFASVSI